MDKKTIISLVIFVAFILGLCGLVLFYFTWLKSNQAVKIVEAEAIAIVQATLPEFDSYPDDLLPPKTIKTEQAEDGWYVAFIQEGSGIPVISANCFYVKNDKSFSPIEYVSSANTAPYGEFSVSKCRFESKLIGGDQDAHGCLIAAGYSWCEVKNKCLRVWEEGCEETSETPGCEVENCHGMEISCGSNKPEACTMMYGLGDKCLQYAQCGLVNGKCQQIENPKFTTCKSCVQNCIDENQSDSLKSFDCESNCN